MDLKKVKKITYSPVDGKVKYDKDDLMFYTGDRNVSIIRVNNTYNDINIELIAKAPSGEVTSVKAEKVKYGKDNYLDFLVPVQVGGKHEAQFKATYSYYVSFSDVFEYESKQCLE